MDKDILIQLGYSTLVAIALAGTAHAVTKDQDLPLEMGPAPTAPMDTHANFQPLHPKDSLHSESPILRDSLEIQNAPTNIAQDTQTLNQSDPEENIAMKPKKVRKVKP
jgi:hypothetical protein